MKPLYVIQIFDDQYRLNEEGIKDVKPTNDWVNTVWTNTFFTQVNFNTPFAVTKRDAIRALKHARSMYSDMSYIIARVNYT